jgi:hypothetical protein
LENFELFTPELGFCSFQKRFSTLPSKNPKKERDSRARTGGLFKELDTSSQKSNKGGCLSQCRVKTFDFLSFMGLVAVVKAKATCHTRLVEAA